MKTVQRLRLAENDLPEYRAGLACPRSRAVAVLVARGWWPHPPAEDRDLAESDFYAVAAFQDLLPADPLAGDSVAFSQAFHEYLGWE